MRILFQLRVVAVILLLGIAGGCRPAPKPHEAGSEPGPDPTDGLTEGFQGVLKLAPWPTLLVMEAAENGDMREVPLCLVTRDWKSLELNMDLRKLDDKLVELQGTPVFSGPARVIQVEPASIVELEGSFGTPGRAAESRPEAKAAATLTGRLFALPFLSRNGPRLPKADDETAITVQQEEIRAGLPVVLLLNKGERPEEFISPLFFMDHSTRPASSLLPMINREVSLHGVPEVQGSWQVLRLDEEPKLLTPVAAQP